MSIGCILIGLAAHMQAELNRWQVAYILSNSFLSDLSKRIRNSLHSFCSSTVVILNEGIVLPI